MQRTEKVALKPVLHMYIEMFFSPLFYIGFMPGFKVSVFTYIEMFFSPLFYIGFMRGFKVSVFMYIQMGFFSLHDYSI